MKWLRSLTFIVPIVALLVAAATLPQAVASPVYDLEDSATITVSSTAAGAAANLVDNQASTYWQSNDAVAAWVEFSWSSPVTIQEITLNATSGSAWGWPRFTFDDDTYIMGCTAAWNSTGTYRFNQPVTTTSVKISIEETYDGNAATVLREVDISASVSATATPTPSGGYADLACADQITASGNFPDVTVRNKFMTLDGNTSTEWASDSDGADSWIEFTWREPVTIHQINLHSRDGSWGVPRFEFTTGTVDGDVEVSTTGFTEYTITPRATLSLRIAIASGGSGLSRGFREVEILGTFGGEVEGTATYSLNSVADNWLNSNSSATNYGLETFFYAGDASTGGIVASSRGILRFNFDLIPPSAQVLSATLRLTTRSDSLGSGNRTIDLYLIKSNWSETQSDWTDRLVEWDPDLQLNVTRSWSTAGAGSTEQVQPASASAVVSNAASAYIVFDVTTDVRKIVSGLEPNFGWVFQDQTEAEGYLRAFYTHEASNSDYRPELVIDFVNQSDAIDASWLVDGNFEDNSPEWSFASGASTRVNQFETSANNVGPAACGVFYAGVDGGYDETNAKPTAISQRFYWPGGTAYVHFYLHDNSNDDDFYTARFHVSRVDGTQPEQFITRSSYNILADTWQSINQTLTLPPGFYDLQIGSQNIAGANNLSDFAVDDITISLNQYMSYCEGLGGPTRTPYPPATQTPTRTPSPSNTPGPSPTRTNTPAVSATPTNTSTPARPTFGNCNFESGTAGWTGTNYSLGLAGGPIGPRYAVVAGTLSQQFAWSGGVAYFSFWIGPGSYGTIVVRNAATNQGITLHSAAAPASWQLRAATANLSAGTYRFEAHGLGSNSTMKIDGVMVAANTYAYCGSSGGPVTPTSGPTSYVTATYTNTPNASLSPTPSLTASHTLTATNTRTPFPTNTPGPTATPIPTDTQPATATQSSAEQTATAQGTTVPTYTPYPTYTPFPTSTPYTPPPQQPPPSWDADCQQPAGGDVAGWAGYYQCLSLSWFSWGPGNTQQLTDMMSGYGDKGPFGAMSEVGDAIGAMRDLLNSQDWSSGPEYGNADPTVFTEPSGSVYDGDGVSFSGGSYGSSCDFALPGASGVFIQGVCWAMEFLRVNKFLPYFQWVVNGAAIILFIAYVVKVWIAKASNA